MSYHSKNTKFKLNSLPANFSINDFSWIAGAFRGTTVLVSFTNSGAVSRSPPIFACFAALTADKRRLRSLVKAYQCTRTRSWFSATLLQDLSVVKRKYGFVLVRAQTYSKKIMQNLQRNVSKHVCTSK